MATLKISVIASEAVRRSVAISKLRRANLTFRLSIDGGSLAKNMEIATH
ncbi:MAG: hypothetical protein IKN18_00565 [Neisseriaceae bacterium]|nr:hypothetical protein [Neisseriaceae bacterium]